MHWLETVIKEQQVLKLCEENPLLDFSCTDDYPQEFEAIVNRQAQITGDIAYKAGIEKMVKWVDATCGWYHKDSHTFLTLSTEEWQAFKQESISKEGK